MPWFWRGDLQGGGVLNDMMCHSALVVRHLLTKPGAGLLTVRPVRVTAHIASLKWSRPEYVKQLQKTMGRDVDYAKHPSEDFASMTIEFETDDHHIVIGEATTSWSVRWRRIAPVRGIARARVFDVVEYARQWAQAVLLTRGARTAGEDLVEKQNAEIGLMPVVANEAVALRIRSGGPAFRARVPRKGNPASHVRRRAGSCESTHDGVSERRAGKNALVSTKGARQVPAGCGARRLATHASVVIVLAGTPSRFHQRRP